MIVYVRKLGAGDGGAATRQGVDSESLPPPQRPPESAGCIVHTERVTKPTVVSADDLNTTKAILNSILQEYFKINFFLI